MAVRPASWRTAKDDDDAFRRQGGDRCGRAYRDPTGHARQLRDAANLADPQAPGNVVAEVIPRAGRLDVLVNNAGLMQEATAEE